VRDLQGKQAGIKIWGISPPLSSEELDDVERQLGAKLPDDYREFLTDYGMYAFSQGVFCPVPPNQIGEKQAPVEFFYGVDRTAGQRADDDLLDAYRLSASRALDSPDIWPPLAEDGTSSVLPIVGNSGGSFICLKIKGDELGTVDYFPPWGRGAIHLADSFDEFIHLLVREWDDE
jgi:hypothetical protein